MMVDLVTLTTLAKLTKQLNVLKQTGGKQGEAGKDGKDGKDGADGSDGKKGVAGKDGLDGKSGLDGKKGKDGTQGSNGEDGVGITSVSQAADGDLVFTLSDGNEEVIELPFDLGSDSSSSVRVYNRGSSEAITHSWVELATGFSSQSLESTIAAGDVYSYVYSNTTLFRLVPSGAEQDAFYTTFSGGALSGLVIGRGLAV